MGEKYIVISPFRDLQDKNFVYDEIGSEFPAKGRKKPSKKRIEELSTDKNLQGKPLIKKVEEQSNTNEDHEKGQTEGTDNENPEKGQTEGTDNENLEKEQTEVTDNENPEKGQTEVTDNKNPKEDETDIIENDKEE